MQKLILSFLLCCPLTEAFSQSGEKFSLYLQSQYNKTIYDRTAGNNPWGLGVGLQLYIKASSKFKATVDFSADCYLEDDKVLRINPDDTPAEDIGGVINLFGGLSWHPSQRIYLSAVAGPSFINSQTLLGMKHSLGYYFSGNQKWTGKISYINIFNRDKVMKQDFGSISFSIGLKIF